MFPSCMCQRKKSEQQFCCISRQALQIPALREVLCRRGPAGTSPLVFSQLARSTPHCTFITDAPYMENEVVSGRTVIPLEDTDAHAEFYLAIRTDAGLTLSHLFDWASKHS